MHALANTGDSGRVPWL